MTATQQVYNNNYKLSCQESVIEAINNTKEGNAMSRRGLMSENLKYEIARELGVDSIVQSEGWGGVSSRDCGNMVRTAIEMAERNMAQGR